MFANKTFEPKKSHYATCNSVDFWTQEGLCVFQLDLYEDMCFLKRCVGLVIALSHESTRV